MADYIIKLINFLFVVYTFLLKRVLRVNLLECWDDDFLQVIRVTYMVCQK